MSGSPAGPGSGSTSDPYVKVAFSPDPGSTFLFDGLHAHEELGRPFLFTVDLTSNALNDVTQLVGASCTVTCRQSVEGSKPIYFNGIVTRVVSSGLVSGSYHYQIELRPWIWLLSRAIDCAIFQNKSPFKIITTIFDNNGFSDYADKRQASAGDTTLDYCVQYRESSFDFVTRLMETYGIYYFFEYADGKHTLNLSDDPGSHKTLSDKIPFMQDMTTGRTVADHVWEWKSAQSLESAKVTYQDYNFTTPATDLTAKSIQEPKHHQYNTYEVYEYPGIYDTTGDGTKLTDVRVQGIGKNRAVFDGTSNSRILRPGWIFSLAGHPFDANNRDYLITSADLTISVTEGSASGADGAKTFDTYRVALHAIPSDSHFRLDRKTPVPTIRGPQTAVVAGTSGEEIDPDKYGRVKVKFYWDRWEPKPPDPDRDKAQPSCWIRVAQTSAGAGWGSMFIPRIGQEVVVEFLEGNPDRPLITGVVYNANMTVPYTLPDNKTRSTVKTNSSPGGSGFNELRFEDKAGQEEVFFQAQKDFNKKVLHDETVTITNNHTTTVQQGNHGTTVSAGNHSLDVSAGKSDVTAATSITLTVGGSSIKIDPSSVTITAATITLQASGSVSVQGSSISVQGSGSVTIEGGSVTVNSPSIALN